MTRFLLTILRGLVLGYLLVVAVVYYGQYTRFYQPKTYSRSSLAAEAATNQMQLFNSAKGEPLGLYAEARASHLKGTLVFFHGRQGSILDRVPYVDVLTSRGYRVVLAEYPGYGARRTETRREDVFVKDALDVLGEVHTKWPGRLTVVGEGGTGSTIAAKVVGSTPLKVSRLILVSPWESRLATAEDNIPWIPSTSLLKEHYELGGALDNYFGVVEVVVPAMEPRRAYEGALNVFKRLRDKPKRIWWLSGATVADWTHYVAPRQWDYLLEPPVGETDDEEVPEGTDTSTPTPAATADKAQKATTGATPQPEAASAPAANGGAGQNDVPPKQRFTVYN